MKPWEQYQQAADNTAKPWEQYGGAAESAPAPQPNPTPQLNPTRQAAAQVWENTSAVDQFGVGVAKPFVELYLGVKKLLGDRPLSVEEIKEIHRLQEVKGGYATAGEIAGELAMMATGGGAVGAVGRRVGGKLVKSVAKHRILADTVGGVALEAAKAPTDETSRLYRASMALAGGAAGAALGKAATGIAKSDAAQALLNKGVRLTPGQAAEGRVVPVLERWMASFPGIRGRTARLQDQAVKDWNLDILRQALPPGVSPGAIKDIGPDAFTEARRLFNAAYHGAYGGMLALQPGLLKSWDTLAADASSKLPSKSAKRLRDILRDISRPLAREVDVDGDAVQLAERILNEAKKKAAKKGNGVEAEFFEQARESLMAALPPDVAAGVRAVNEQYAKFSLVRDAAIRTKGARERGYFKPDELLTASTRRSSDSTVAEGRALFQPEAQQMGEFVGQGDPAGKVGLVERFGLPAAAGYAAVQNPALAVGAAAATPAMVSEPARRILLGETNPQKLLADRLRQASRRTGLTPAGAGAVSADQLNNLLFGDDGQ